MLKVFLLALIVGTWNGNWFPSGRAEHRAHPEVEAATIHATGAMLAQGLREIDPSGKEDVIISLCEIRNRSVAEQLVEAVGRSGLKVASVSAYRRRDRFDQQQNVILTTLPVVESHWARWTPKGEIAPPRGFAVASVVVEPAITARVYSVHLKSNYGATTPEDQVGNRARRTVAIDEFLTLEKENDYVILAGDFNADPWRKPFVGETIFMSLETAGYLNLMSLLPPKARVTRANKRFGNSCLDHIVTKGFVPEGMPRVQPSDQLSDHSAIFARVKALSSAP